MKKKGRILAIVIGIVMVLGLILMFYNKKTGIHGFDVGEVYGSDVVEGVNDVMPTHCVTENGYLYVKNQRIYFFDINTKTEHVLCDDLSCVHFSSDCGAFYNNYNIIGLAAYHGNIYHVDLSMDGRKYQLIRTDFGGNNKEVVADFKMGNYGENEWYLQQIGKVCYGYDQAYMELQYQSLSQDGNEIQTTQCVEIDLNTGRTIDITEREARNEAYEIESIVKEGVIIRRTLAENDNEEYLFYQPASGELNLVEENRLVSYWTGYSMSTIPVYDFLGEYEGNPLYEHFAERYLSDKQNATMCSWNTSNNERKEILEIENCTPIMLGEGGYHQYVYDDKYLLCSEAKPNGKLDIIRLNLDTRKKKKLFEDTENISFRLIGQTRDSFIGKIYEFPDEESMLVSIYRIKKDDYYANDFSKKIFLQKIEY